MLINLLIGQNDMSNNFLISLSNSTIRPCGIMIFYPLHILDSKLKHSGRLTIY